MTDFGERLSAELERRLPVWFEALDRGTLTATEIRELERGNQS